MTTAALHASQSYFNGFPELFSAKSSATQRVVALLKVISLATIIVPVVFGVTYGITSLANRKVTILPPQPQGGPRPIPPLPTGAKRTDHIAGGILPYYINKQGEAYILLSKEKGGVSKGKWADFGGARDREETTAETAAREGFEESKDFLGTKKEIQRKIEQSEPLGMKAPRSKYAMFLMQVNDAQYKSLNNANFKKKTFHDHHRMEKTDIAWVKANDLFKAVQNQNNSVMTINGKREAIRGCFAKTLRCALQQNKNEQAILRRHRLIR